MNERDLNALKAGPWSVVLNEGVLEEAMRQIAEYYPVEPQQADMLKRLARWLEAVNKDPMEVLGFPPMSTADPDFYRFPCDEHHLISAYADMRIAQKQIKIIKILVLPQKKEKK